MALSSPRFRNESRLQQIELGHGALRAGATGRLVHLIQMALVDLGQAMPRSTRSTHYSPDGIYGTETTEAVKSFQRATTGLEPDGAVGQQTLRALDRRHSNFTHRIGLHFRSLSLTNVPFDRMLTSAELAYAQYGIQIVFQSGQSLRLSDEEQQRFNVVGQNCDWQMESGAFAELHRLGSPFPANDIGVFIVNQFQETDVLGCGGHAATRPSCAVTHDCSRWDPAHEIGHVLLTSSFVPVHSRDRRNLMFETSSNGREPLALTEKQLQTIRSSPLCQAI